MTTKTEAPIIETGFADLNTVEDAVSQRRSVRAFKPDPVPLETVDRILSLAGRAPSGTNMQPWQVHVLTGAARDRLSEALVAAHYDGAEHKNEYAYYPASFFEPYKARRRKVGWDMYGLLGIGKGDFEKTQAQHARNYMFFDAPVGLVFTINRDLEIGSWLDYGMYLQNIMILARTHGLETCPQAAFAGFHKIIREHIPVGDENIVVCGMSLGYADWEPPIAELLTEREPTSSYVKWHAE